MATNTRKSAHSSSPTPPAPFTFSRHSRAYESRPPERNEDMVLIDQPRALAAIFDGVGGRDGLGRIASRLAARAIRRSWRRTLAPVQPEPSLLNACDLLDLPATLCLLLSEANEQIRTEGVRQAKRLQPPSDKVPATTVALAVFCRNHAHSNYTMTYAHVGDSRIYLLPDHEPLKRLTMDDGYFSLLLAKGTIQPEDALRIDQATSADQLSETERSYFDRRNGITQALGDSPLTIHTAQTPIAPGDRILLCTDGIHDNLTDLELEHVLRTSARTTAARTLVQHAIERSHEHGANTIRAKKDDMSAIVITCHR